MTKGSFVCCLEYFLFILLNSSFFLFKNVQCTNFSKNITYIEEIKNVLLETNDNGCVSAILDNPNFLQYLDASGKIPSGIFLGNFFELGSFDSCYGSKVTIDNVEMDGKYCLNTIPIDFSQLIPHGLQQIITPTPRMIGSSQSLMGFHIAHCVPSVCQAENLQNITGLIWDQLGLESLLQKPIFLETLCYSKATDPELSDGAIATIVFLSVVFGIVCISTAYEYYLNCTQKKPIHGILLAFSVISNGKKLIATTSSFDQLLCLNGIRALSMMWVVIGHDYSSAINGPIQNFVEVSRLMTSNDELWLISAPLSVDTFFAIGGLVTVYTFLKSIDKGVKFNIPLYYLHRYLRLTPALAVMVLLHYNLLSYMGNGPLWVNIQSSLTAPCQYNWWAGLLYLQNFITTNNSCVPQTWYLSVDFQLFLLSPIVLYPLSKWPRVAYGILAVLVPTGIIVPAIVTYVHEISGFIGVSGNNPDTAASQDDYLRYYYSQTHARFGPYVIGMIFGIIIYKLKKNNLMPPKTKKNQLIAICLWLIAITGLVSCVYGGADLMVAEYDRVGSALYNGFFRNAWALSVCLVIILCVANFGGPINEFLSFPLFQFLTKLSYSIFLVHYSFLFMMRASARVPLYVTHWNMAHQFWGDFMYSLGLAIILCLCFESPVIILEKYLLGNGRPSKSHNAQNEKNKKLEV